MARVYRAWDGRLRREVAIKVMDDRSMPPEIIKRFLDEARSALGLNHPNICTNFDIGEENGTPYLVMELLEGETLKQRMAEGALPAEEILRYGAEVSDALAAAHTRGILHGDIQPANIFLVKSVSGPARAKVLNFGLARIEHFAAEACESGTHLASAGAALGAVSYVSPEQVRGERVDARSDLFSLGVVLYEMATGRLPFQGDTTAQVFVRLLGQSPPEAVRSLNDRIPAELEQVILRLLEKNPRERFQSATELCDELQDLAEKCSGWLTRVRNLPLEAPAPATASQGPQLLDPVPLEHGHMREAGGDPELSEQRTTSGGRQIRSSIATHPKISFPAISPYAGQQTSQHAKLHTERAGRPDDRHEKETAESPASSPSSGYADGEGATNGLSWRWIVLAMVLIVLAGGLLAWRY